MSVKPNVSLILPMQNVKNMPFSTEDSPALVDVAMKHPACPIVKLIQRIVNVLNTPDNMADFQVPEDVRMNHPVYLTVSQTLRIQPAPNMPVNMVVDLLESKDSSKINKISKPNRNSNLAAGQRGDQDNIFSNLYRNTHSPNNDKIASCH